MRGTFKGHTISVERTFVSARAVAQRTVQFGRPVDNGRGDDSGEHRPVGLLESDPDETEG